MFGFVFNNNGRLYPWLIIEFVEDIRLGITTNTISWEFTFMRR